MLVPVSLIDYQQISYPFHPPCDYHKLYESGSPEKQEENKIYVYIEEETFYFRHFIYLGIGFPKCGQWQGQSLQGGGRAGDPWKSSNLRMKAGLPLPLGKSTSTN